MKRSSVLLLLLLLPLTMAPRTSLNPEGSALQLTGVLSRTQIRPGAAVTFVVQARNTTDDTLASSSVVITVDWRGGKPDEVALAASPRCQITPAETGYVVTCDLGSLDPGARRTVRVTARPSTSGQLTFDAVGIGALGPIDGGVPQVVEVEERR